MAETAAPTKPEIMPGVPAPDNGKPISAEDMANQDKLDAQINFPPEEGHDEVENPNAKPETELNIPSLKDFYAGRKDETEIAKVVLPTKKDEGKKEEPVKKEETSPDPNARDFTGIPDEDQVVFKRMSNEAFAKLKPIYLEHKNYKTELDKRDAKIKELSTKKDGDLPESYYEHPDSYVLSKEFATKSRTADFASQIKRHWQLQLARVRKGEDWVDLEKDDKGNWNYSKPKTATAEAEAEIIELLQGAVDQERKYVEDRDKFVSDYQAKQKEIPTFIQKVVDDFFPGYNKPDHPTAKIQQEVINNLHPALRNSPVSILLAMTAANNAILRGEYEKIKAENDKLKGIKKDGESAPPTRRSFAAGEVDKPKIADMSDFRRERGQE